MWFEYTTQPRQGMPYPASCMRSNWGFSLRISKIMIHFYGIACMDGKEQSYVMKMNKFYCRFSLLLFFWSSTVVSEEVRKGTEKSEKNLCSKNLAMNIALEGRACTLFIFLERHPIHSVQFQYMQQQ